jgi:hypothetical protein
MRIPNATAVRPTRYELLGYTQDAPNCWRVVELQSGQERRTGPIYKSKAELLADLGYVASNWGYASSQFVD